MNDIRIKIMSGIALLFIHSYVYSQQPYEIVESYAKEQASGETPQPGAQENNISIYAKPVTIEPAIDGMPDPVWDKAEGICVWDSIAQINVHIKAVYTADKIFFLVRFNDPTESRQHKVWHWNTAEDMYIQGFEREDTFIFKWNMEEKPVDLSIYADNEYYADIWFWKADRTDPVGYADDKMHIFSDEKMNKSTEIITRTGATMYLSRTGDEGREAYFSSLPTLYEGDTVHHYNHCPPDGSRADIQAKGVWNNNQWTIEFSRALQTGNADDISFDTGKTYLFGISRYEIAGGLPEPDWNQPLYNAGDVNNAITLIFDKE
ncbi:hypothetical protein KDK77_08225 [bacterium]|nr:hypothetical protein [bacterium]